MIVLIDNGHGNNTPGKRSPNGLLREWKYTRNVARNLQKKLTQEGYTAHLIVEEVWDITLTERVKRVNAVCKEFGKENVIFISIHCNAMGDGKQWMSGRGWEAYTSPGKTKSDALAASLYQAAHECFPGHAIREDWTDGDADKEAGYYVLKNTACPAVLTENFFMDNLADYEFMISAEGMERIVECHYQGIVNYINSQK